MKFVELNTETQAYFQAFYKQHNVIGYLEYENPNMAVSGRVVLKMKPGYKGWTPYGTARDCGDHYILAQYDRYDRVDKKTMEITKDVEDR